MDERNFRTKIVVFRDPFGALGARVRHQMSGARKQWKQLALSLCILFTQLIWAAESFVAPALSSGSLAVQLIPTPGVLPNQPTVVSFGLPFPRGSITSTGLSTLRVTFNGQEIAAYVSELSPWRHRRNSALDGTSVRVALVQIERSFSGTTPAAAQTITVHWGGSPRSLHRPNRATRAETWYPVTSGSFQAADNVLEPKVYAVLPASWLGQGVLRANRTLAFDASNLEARDNPASNDAIATWPGYTEADRAFKNNFYTVVNRDDPAVTPANQCPYRVGFEPWLYDRAATMFALYFKSGYYTALREAIQHAEFYRARVNSAGHFSLKPGDNKYAYSESLAYAYWLTGDVSFLPEINRTADAHNNNHQWSTSLGFWTERMVAFKLMAHTVAWEIDGGASRRANVDAIVSALAAHQNGLPGIPSSNRVDGGFYHLGSQHDGDWVANSYGASPWMTALLSDALRRAYQSDESISSADMLRRIGSFLRSSLRVGSSAFGGMSTASRYVIGYDGQDIAGTSASHDEDHALDIAAAMAWGDYFGVQLNQRDPLLSAAVRDTYLTFDRSVNDWIRPQNPSSGLPAFFVIHWRKWAWEHRTSDGLAFAVQSSTSDTQTLFANGFE